jgi:hypothetical protein
MQSATKISLVTLVVAVAALVLALWPVVADAPWENDSQLKTDILDLQIEISSLQVEISSLEAAADTPASETEICRSALIVMEKLVNASGGKGMSDRVADLFRATTQTQLDNGCFAD